MRSSASLSSRPRHARGVWLAALGTLALGVLVACGGGGDDAPAAQPLATQATVYSSGPIGGWGSVIVGDVRYDETGAVIQDDEDDSLKTAADLKLGMMVEVDSGPIDAATGKAVALRLRFGSEITGPVASVDAGGASLTVLDQRVEVLDTTVFGEALPGGLADLAAGDLINVHAMFDGARGVYIATRIALAPEVPAYRLRGPVSDLDEAGQTLRIGGALIDFAAVPQAERLPLAEGMRLRVLLQTEPQAGRWVALALRPGARPVDDRPDVRLQGHVNRFVSPQHFAVRGLEIDARAARFEPNPEAVTLGAVVAVQGEIRSGVVIASHVKVLRPDDPDWRRIVLHGSVSALDTTAKTFMLRGILVHYDQVEQWRNGDEAQLADGARVIVKGGWSTDRHVLVAKGIGFGE